MAEGLEEGGIKQGWKGITSCPYRYISWSLLVLPTEHVT
jgi:hypothetical protein